MPFTIATARMASKTITLFRDLADLDVAEHDYAEAIMQLQSYGACLRSPRRSRMACHLVAVPSHANIVVPRFDVQAVPVALFLVSEYRRSKQIDTAARVFRLYSVDDLDLITEVGRSLGEVRYTRIPDGGGP
jgi:hypothetical protein